MTKKVLVGMLLLGALFIFGLATFYVENWQFYLGKGYHLRVDFPVAHTLDTGDIVRMAGVAVGTVEELEINTEEPTKYPVEARLWIQSEVKVRADDIATIRISSVFGGTYVTIDRGGDPKAFVLKDGDRITNVEVTPSITEVIEQSKATLTSVNEAFAGMTTVMSELKEGKGALGRLLRDEELAARLDEIADDAAKAVEGLKTAADKLEKGEGVLGKLLMDDELAEQVDEFTADMQKMAADLKEGKGTLGKLLTDDELYSQLNDSIGTIADAAKMFREGEGILPKLLSDVKIAEDIQALAADARVVAENLKGLSADMKEGKGTIGELLTSDDAYQRLMTSLEDLQNTMASVAKGEGTLGRLVQDDKVYSQITQLLDDVQGIVETYREQSPVISFAGALFGAF